MKKILIFAVLASLASCKDQAAEMEVAKQNTIDSIQIVQEKQRVIDSMQAITVTKVEKEVIYVNNNTAQPVVEKRKGMSNTAKGALIGAGVGAATGAVVSKKKGTGAIIGGLSGAAVGAGTGAIIDDKKNKK
ncbi:YMGG-like glycine zipper-containing protein [Flavobacterium ardleyense]|uniref:YMGG-like glycine zipper-containing protein n=1 Tax=Flavobacterium ardleyense TaxID=2038737 RepID=A0ABW5Z792_9FLAO